MRPTPEPAVIAWLDRQPAESIWTTSITLFEIGFGLELLPDGERRRRLSDQFDTLIDTLLERRVLDFDRQAARATAGIAARLRATGRRGELADMQIAGIAGARKAVLATRNTADFESSGISIIDPWQAVRT